MKSLPVVVNIALFAGVCATATYWGMQWMKPPVRPVAAPAVTTVAPPNLDAATSLFGGRPVAAVVASNYQLKGVVVAAGGAVSQAIISTDGRAAQAVALNSEVAPGTTLKEVQAKYIVINEGGVSKRLELPEAAHGGVPNPAGGQVPMPPPAPQFNPPVGNPPQVNQGQVQPGPPVQPQQLPMNMPMVGAPPQSER